MWRKRDSFSQLFLIKQWEILRRLELINQVHSLIFEHLKDKFNVCLGKIYLLLKD